MQLRLVGVKSKVGFHILLIVLTFLTLTFKEGVWAILFAFEENKEILTKIFWTEYPYAVSLLVILFCHEMGHYIPARIYNLKTTLPYFIPMPASPVGTMGAVIQIQEPIQDKIKLFDIGVGGPVASLVLSAICWVIGLYYSNLVDLAEFANQKNILNFGDSLFTYYTGQWILGPYDPVNTTILIHPLAKAGWVGLLITAINLIPFGQLDGGHIVYALFGEKYRSWIHYLFLFFLLLGLVSFTWVIWGFIIYYFIKIEHPYVPDSSTELGLGRKFLGYFMLASFVLIFVPIPLSSGETMLIQDIFNYIQQSF
ncbi:MAG TPA: site-2 protease family protein [Leptospiraceae bacterium]|nr:site-2 protease family protein [Leptospiraceae bacterium]HMW07099.1 site-2 protease family protein [Leptospiraceae bacterium]HMX31773.1 site-2 protease family protein [Leptospiraceae bacterium]HMY32584.1 site-2 protease family protein [Leptospiraceae bacterium]HMZ63882.1 site-2 protease family protein [Leptospiraceae bacterium]